jgi:hypothetical protein
MPACALFAEGCGRRERRARRCSRPACERIRPFPASAAVRRHTGASQLIGDAMSRKGLMAAAAAVIVVGSVAVVAIRPVYFARRRQPRTICRLSASRARPQRRPSRRRRLSRLPRSRTRPPSCLAPRRMRPAR